jgi:hypothetical protein
MKDGKERRRKKRWKVAVLVRCAIPKFSDKTFEMEMWAKDVNEKGMQLEWTKGLNVTQIQTEGKEAISKSVRFDDVSFIKGAKVKVQDLFYDDDGSPFIEGKILWARQASNSGNWSLGVQFNDAKKQPQALLGAFQDFLSIVKNPIAAIEKASRKK